MLYEEFLKISDVAKMDITYNEYKEVIEPLYMKSAFEKEDFCAFISSIYTAEPTIEICRTMNNCFIEPTPKKLRTFRCLADCVEKDNILIFYVAAYNKSEATTIANNQLSQLLGKEKADYELIKINEILPLKEEAKKVLVARLLEENEKIKEEG